MGNHEDKDDRHSLLSGSANEREDILHSSTDGEDRSASFRKNSNLPGSSESNAS